MVKHPKPTKTQSQGWNLNMTNGGAEDAEPNTLLPLYEREREK